VLLVLRCAVASIGNVTQRIVSGATGAAERPVATIDAPVASAARLSSRSVKATLLQQQVLAGSVSSSAAKRHDAIGNYPAITISFGG